LGRTLVLFTLGALRVYFSSVCEETTFSNGIIEVKSRTNILEKVVIVE
jgi:hypothetical protein